MFNKAIGVCLILVLLILSACTNDGHIQTQGEQPITSTEQQKQIETSTTPNIMEMWWKW
jgi:outer membrane biogenesis lipoprotein LolB